MGEQLTEKRDPKVKVGRPVKIEESKNEETTKTNEKRNIINFKFLKSKKGMIISAISLGTIVLISAGVSTYKYLAYKKCPNLSSKSLSDTLLENEANTCFDELIEIEEYNEYVENVNNLEYSLDLKEELIGLNLDKYNEGLNLVDVSYLSLEDVQNLIEDFNNDKKRVDLDTPSEETLTFEYTVSSLTSYKYQLIENTYIDNVDSINKYTDLLIKSLVVDSLGWSSIDVSAMETNLLDLNTKTIKVTYTSELGKEYEIIIPKDNSIYYLVKDVRELNKLIESNESKKFHAIYESIINRLKLVQKFDYECKNGVMKQEGNNLTKKLY